MELEKLYELLETLPEKKFDEIEAQFCTALYYEIPAEKRPLCVTAFLTIADWSATSLRSGVWTFYEATPVRELEKTAAFLEKTDEGELFTIFSLGFITTKIQSMPRIMIIRRNGWRKQKRLILGSWSMRHG